MKLESVGWSDIAINGSNVAMFYREERERRDERKEILTRNTCKMKEQWEMERFALTHFTL